jgi:hypothetical protein
MVASALHGASRSASCINHERPEAQFIEKKAEIGTFIQRICDSRLDQCFPKSDRLLDLSGLGFAPFRRIFNRQKASHWPLFFRASWLK